MTPPDDRSYHPFVWLMGGSLAVAIIGIVDAASARTGVYFNVYRYAAMSRAWPSLTPRLGMAPPGSIDWGTVIQ